MKRAIALIVPIVACALGLGPARAGQILTFEGLKNFEPVGDYFNGGMGGLGSGPGPNYGITFGRNSLAYIHGQQSGTVTPYPGDPSPPTVLLVWGGPNGPGAGQPISTIMDDPAGASGALDFYYIAIGRPATVQIWSGPDGTGTMLASQNYATTGTQMGNAAFSPEETLPFSGMAESVVFRGGNDQLALDNIAFINVVPEPSAWISLATGLTCSYLFHVRRRKGSAP